MIEAKTITLIRSDHFSLSARSRHSSRETFIHLTVSLQLKRLVVVAPLVEEVVNRE